MNPSLLPSLAWFAVIAEHGSFSRAAQALGVSPAAVSQSLKALEQELGVRLLYRTTRHMSLTEAGQRLFDRLRPSLGEIARAVENAGDAEGAPSGLLRVNTSRLAARGVIEPHLREFHARYPGITLELVMADGLSNIIADGCDAGIRLGRTLAEHMVAVPISPALTMAMAASPDYLDRHGVPATPADLVHHACLNYRFVGSGALYDWQFTDPTDPGRHFTQTVTGGLISNDDSSLVRAAVQGMGLLQLVDLAIREPLTDGRLVRVLSDWTYRHTGFYLYAPSREQMPAKVRALIDFLVEKRDTLAAL